MLFPCCIDKTCRSLIRFEDRALEVFALKAQKGRSGAKQGRKEKVKTGNPPADREGGDFL